MGQMRRQVMTEFAALAVAERPTATLADDDGAAPEVLPTGWRGPITFEGVETGDKRYIDKGALVWDTPVTLRSVAADVGGHDGAEAVGRIDRIWRGDDGAIMAEGPFDLGSDAGREIARQVAAEYKNGVSVDLDEMEWEYRDADGNTLADDDPEAMLPDLDEMVFATTAGRIRAATVVDIPAFREARIAAVYDYVSPEHAPDGGEQPESVSAAAPPIAPPAAWFRDPMLAGPTPLTVTDDGRVFGHLATWTGCHTGNPSGPGVCVTAPHSATGYASFHTGTLLTAEGETISVGHLTMGTGHASPSASTAATRSHYDNTGTAVADVRVGEDKYGPWVAGALRPGVDAAKVRALRSSPLSGDWRRVNGALDLFAILAVNVPGFPIPRPAGMVAAGEVQSMVAAGMLPPRRLHVPAGQALDPDDVAYLKRLARRGRAAESADLARRVRAASLRATATRLGMI